MADFTLRKAWKADPLGNLIYQKKDRTFNPLAAIARKITIAEVAEIVPLGQLVSPELLLRKQGAVNTMTILINSEVKEFYDKSTASLPKGRYTCQDKVVEYVSMRDRVKLATTIYFPDKGASWPVLFTRNPYPHNKSILEAVYLPLVEHGFCLVIQDCRGTGDSEGKWEPFINERKDGIDSLNWLIKQKWMNGNIGTFGRSYSGFTQWIVGDKLPKEVKTMFLEVYGVDRYRQVYMNGMFREDIYTSWAFANSGVKSELAAAELYQKALEILPADQRDKKLLGTTLPFYQHYIKEISGDSSYWKDSIWEILKVIPGEINIPVVITGGWSDHHLDGSILGFEQLRDEVKAKSKLIIGPWDHIGGTTGNLDYPNNSKFGFMNIDAHLNWFNYQLKSEGEEFKSEVYVIGQKNWQEVKEWPPAAHKFPMFLNADSSLTENPNAEGSISFEYDPRNPLSTNGGSALLAWISPEFTELPHGVTKQVDYHDRNDVLTFKSDSLTKPLKIMGKMITKLLVSSSAEDTAFTVKVSEELVNGETYNIADGISSIRFRNDSPKPLDYQKDEKVELTIKLWDVAWQCQTGSRIRVDISSSNFPMYHVHSNTKGPWSEKDENSIVATQTLYCGVSGCKVILPIVEEQED